MPERLSDDMKLELLNTWLGCDPRAGEALWRQPGLIEDKGLEEQWTQWICAWCEREFRAGPEMYFFKRCWDSLHWEDQETFARYVVWRWQDRIKRWDGSGGKQPGDFASWPEFSGYLARSRKNVLDYLQKWCRNIREEINESDLIGSDEDATGPPEPVPEPQQTPEPEQDAHLDAGRRHANEQAAELIEAFAAKLTQAPGQSAVFQCVRDVRTLPVEILLMLEARNEVSEEFEQIRQCAFASGMTQDTYNQNAKRLRTRWRKFRDHETVRPRWEALLQALRAIQPPGT